MTVHINQFATSTPVGPGIPMTLDSDNSTWTSGSTWRITFALSAGGVSPLAAFSIPAIGPSQQVIPWTHFGGMTQTAFTPNFQESGGPVHVQAQLALPSSIISDTGDQSIPIDWSSGLGQQALQLQATAPSGGLTPTQATQLQNSSDNSDTLISNWNTYTTVTLPSLQDVLNSIISGITTTITGAAGAVPATLSQLFSWITLDKLTLVSITGGETCDPVDQTLGGSFTGVIIRATTIPDTYPFTAPGDTWTPLDLAVVEFVRGTDVIKRFGLHTTTHMEYPLPGLLTIPATELPVDLLPPDYHLKIWWGNGVCGEAFAMVLP